MDDDDEVESSCSDSRANRIVSIFSSGDDNIKWCAVVTV